MPNLESFKLKPFALIKIKKYGLIKKTSPNFMNAIQTDIISNKAWLLIKFYKIVK